HRCNTGATDFGLRVEGSAMLRVIGVLMVAFGCMGIIPVHADDVPFDGRDAKPRSILAVKWQSVQSRIAEDAARLAACRAEAWMCSDEELRLEAIVATSRMR